MTIVATTQRRGGPGHAFCVPIVRELPVPHPAAGVVMSGAW